MALGLARRSRRAFRLVQGSRSCRPLDTHSNYRLEETFVLLGPSAIGFLLGPFPLSILSLENVLGALESGLPGNFGKEHG